MKSSSALVHRSVLGVLVASAVTASSAATFAQTPAERCADSGEEAQRLQRDKKLGPARALALECASQSCPAFIRADCASILREIDAAEPTVVFRARDGAGTDLVHVRVQVDGEIVAQSADGVARPIEIGAHRVRYEADGLLPREEVVVIAEGEKSRVIVMTLEAPARPPADPPPVSSAGRGPGAGPWIVGGLGAIGLGVFGTFEVLARLKKADLDATCRTACSEAMTAPGRTFEEIAFVGLGVGAAGVLASAIWFLAAPRRVAATARVGLAPAPGGAWIGISTGF